MGIKNILYKYVMAAYTANSLKETDLAAAQNTLNVLNNERGQINVWSILRFIAEGIDNLKTPG